MRKLTKSVSLIAIVFMLIGVNSCTKDSVVSNDSKTTIHKFNPDETYPFVLPATMQPFQYAVYEDDEDMLFEYIQSKLESEENGYFILSYSFNTDGSLINYGFITETSSYYDPNIWIIPSDTINSDDNGGGMCFDSGKKEFKEKKAAREFAMGKAKTNHAITIYGNRRGGWVVTYVDKP